jgi:hypothetical protein
MMNTIQVEKTQTILKVTFPSGHVRSAYGHRVSVNGKLLGIVEHMGQTWEAITLSGSAWNFRTRKDAVQFIVDYGEQF